MSLARSTLTASIIGSLTLFLFPILGDATAESAEGTVRNRPAHQGRNARVTTPQSYNRKPARKPAPPEGILLKDLTTGQTLFEQHADQPMPPASLTKIMSAIVILEEGDLEDPVTVSRRAAAARGTRLRLKPGQVLPLRGLLEAMLIRSANDACVAAAEHVGGDEGAFVAKMNATAEAIGLTRTRFRNACGFDMDDHYSTAEDLAKLTGYAMANDTFAAIVREPAAVIQTVNQRKTFIARTTNRLLNVMDGAVGVKTGYTRKAGRCLITVVRRADKELLLVLLNSRQRWRTARAMIEGALRFSPPSLTAIAR
jgi:D-alanyl-D-alanine carboxypeptidase (penicillin-binding protein 5/6)